jgi:hypothetical protein
LLQYYIDEGYVEENGYHERRLPELNGRSKSEEAEIEMVSRKTLERVHTIDNKGISGIMESCR